MSMYALDNQLNYYRLECEKLKQENERLREQNEKLVKILKENNINEY